ncbi:unnamed protein product, partial [Rotaria sp. Silwood2]
MHHQIHFFRHVLVEFWDCDDDGGGDCDDAYAESVYENAVDEAFELEPELS